MLKERYLEENFFKKIDRALHAEDYAKLKDELQLHRAAKRLLEPEVEDLRMQYASVKNSPQGAEIKFELDQKLKEQHAADEKLEIYKDLGRKGLGVSPTQYKVNNARKQGATMGGIAGLGAGALTALGANSAIQSMTESNLTFKDRLVEEQTWDKVKEFAGNNKALTAGLGGAGLGALYNYASGGAGDMAQERSADLVDFRQEATKTIAADQMPVGKDIHMAMSDKIADIKNPSLWQSFKNGSWDSDIRKENELIDIRSENPSAGVTNSTKKFAAWDPIGSITTSGAELGPRDSMIGDFKVDTKLNPEENWNKDLNSRAEAIGSSNIAIDRGINANEELSDKRQDLQQDVLDSTSDSYRNKILGGAALGAGGSYATRKLKRGY